MGFSAFAMGTTNSNLSACSRWLAFAIFPPRPKNGSFATTTSTHHGHAHEIWFDSETEAHGIVAMEDWIFDADRKTLLINAASLGSPTAPTIAALLTNSATPTVSGTWGGTHGGTDALGFAYAIGVAVDMVRYDYKNKLIDGLAKLKPVMTAEAPALPLTATGGAE